MKGKVLIEVAAYMAVWALLFGIPTWNNFKDGLHEIGYDLGINEWQPRICVLPKE